MKRKNNTQMKKLLKIYINKEEIRKKQFNQFHHHTKEDTTKLEKEIEKKEKTNQKNIIKKNKNIIYVFD